MKKAFLSSAAGLLSAVALGVSGAAFVAPTAFAQPAPAQPGAVPGAVDAASLAALAQAAIDALGADATEDQIAATITAVLVGAGADADTEFAALAFLTVNNSTNATVASAISSVVANQPITGYGATGGGTGGGAPGGGAPGGDGAGTPPAGGGGTSDY